MRPLEILTLLLLGASACVPLVRRARRPPWLSRVPALALGCAALQMLIEGYRWSMVPAYALAVLFTVLFAVPSFVRRRRASHGRPSEAESRARRAIQIGGAVVGLLVVAGAALPPAMFPVFALPVPSGPLAIGTVAVDLVDSTRAEVFTPDPSDHREVFVRVWYPAAKTPGARPMSFWGPTDAVRTGLAQALGLPEFLFQHLRYVTTHTVPGATPATTGAPYPVILFSHGYAQGFESQNTVQIEELASHGYVVASIDHPYEAGIVAFPDGRRITLSKAQLDTYVTQMKGAAPTVQRYMVTTDSAKQDALLRAIYKQTAVLDTSLRIWTADTRFVLDVLGRVDSGGIAGRGLSRSDTAVQRALSGKLDLTRVGLYGMSFGGTTAGQVCVVDPRCTAGLNLDGLQYGDMLDHPVERPFAFAASQPNALAYDPVFRSARGPAYRIVVDGTYHLDYTDFPLISPLFKRMHMLGLIDARRMERILNAYTLAFFDTHVKGRPDPLLSGPSPLYPEVHFTKRDATATLVP